MIEHSHENHAWVRFLSSGDSSRFFLGGALALIFPSFLTDFSWHASSYFSFFLTDFSLIARGISKEVAEVWLRKKSILPTTVPFLHLRIDYKVQIESYLKSQNRRYSLFIPYICLIEGAIHPIAFICPSSTLGNIFKV